MRHLFLAVVGATAVASTGCFLNAYPSDPALRMTVLMNQSEDLRQIQYELMRFWLVESPSHLTYDRVDGSLQ